MRARLAASMTGKLVLGQLLVVFAGAGTLLLVALSIGPGIFHHHIREALGYVPPDVLGHLDMAFSQATLVSLAVAVGAALVTALGLSTIVSIQVVRPVRDLATAAQLVARGSHTARVQARGSDELAQLAGAFNEMAASLQRAEEARRQLLADVAHELRNPLATVESYIEALADGVLPADTENWNAIRAETTRLNRLVDDLRKVSLAEAHQLDLDRQPTELQTIIDDAIKAATPAYQAKRVTLDTAAPAPSSTADVDRERLAEVLANLLANALRHTPTAGSVHVTAQCADGFAEIAVTDTGEGISRAHLDRVFERFYRVDAARSRATGGTGIGLAIVRAIVEAHHGTVRATSQGIGHGASFILRLPTSAADAHPASLRGRHHAPPPSPSRVP